MQKKFMKCPNNFLLSALIFGLFLLTSCSKSPEPNEYVSSLERFFSFSQKGVVLTNHNIESAPIRGFADFTGDNIQDMFEIRDRELSNTNFKLWIFEGYKDVKTKLLNFTDPYAIEIKWEENIKWGDYVEYDTADVNGDGFADLVLTEYTEHWDEDEFKIAVSLNKGVDRSTKKINFRWVNNIIDKKLNTSFANSFVKFIDEREAEQNNFCFGNACNTYDHFEIKWADMDNSGTDDLIILWRDSRDDLDLLVKVFHTNASIPSKIFHQLTFSYHESFIFPKVFAGDYRNYFRLRKIDTGDFNNDGLGDFIFVAEKTDERVLLKFALNTSSLRRYEGMSFMTDPSTEYPEIDWALLTKITDKIKMIDMNADGCTDYAHIGESSYFPDDPKGKEISNAKSIYYMLADCKKAKTVLSNVKFSKKLIAIQWPNDRIPKEQEKVIALSIDAKE